MTSRQKRAIPLYAALVLIVLCTTFIVSRYGPVSALSVNMVRPPSPEMIELVVKEAEEYIRKERYNQAAVFCGVCWSMLRSMFMHNCL